MYEPIGVMIALLILRVLISAGFKIKKDLFLT